MLLPRDNQSFQIPPANSEKLGKHKKKRPPGKRTLFNKAVHHLLNGWVYLQQVFIQSDSGLAQYIPGTLIKNAQTHVNDYRKGVANDEDDF